MKYSDIKKLKSFCEALHSEPDWREILTSIIDDTDDFEVNNVRFIKDDYILSIMVDEIFNDNCILGCFNAWFIAENSDLPIEMVEACQSSGAYEAIGISLNNMMSENQKEAFCEAYAGADGFGHHFNHYDSNEEELHINGCLYHVFDNH